MPKALSLLEKFARVKKPAIGCWIWPYSKNGKGRAMFKGRSAPRQLYKAMIGPLEDHIGVLHSCDNPACVRPDHWFPGDQLLNVRDAIAKGRFAPGHAPPGEDHHFAKLTTKKAAQVKSVMLTERAENGGRMPRGRLEKLSKRFSISRTQLHRIAAGQRWGSVLS